MKNPIKLNGISTLPKEKITEAKAKKEIVHLIEKLSTIQNKLYAQRKYAVLIILQGMDTSGKDSAVKHVFSGINPAGCNVKSFKVPTLEETLHHFLWRVVKECPEKGMIELFNRSHYESILVPMVHKSATGETLKERCEEINAFEKGLVNDNTIVFKFYLHVSHKEQVKRLKDRKTDEHKRWKYQKEDILAISKHNDYKKAYEFVFENCSEDVTWQIVPAVKKWYKNYCILRSIVKELERYDIHYPKTEL
ncbi:MAG TPA: PPK2 family polyphosphate kinase [Bacteroidia bacterium]|nr:PPK2 family polyphosphate kinase [Bacteroidia bacterium]